MKTYFIRHSSELDINQAMLDRMWEEQYAGIHYPHDRHGTFKEGDCTSLDPKDYDDRGRSSMNILQTIAQEGGYVYTTYRGIPGAKLGIVKPGSQVQLLRGEWGSKNGLQGREAILKVLKLDKVINLTAVASLPMSTVQPRQGTICEWRKVGKRVRNLIEGEVYADLDSLNPDLQEVMCMEFMRTSAAAELGLPVLQSTLAPIGRTMKDVDIYGLSTTGQRVIAQVTYHTLGTSAASGKLRKLDPYADNGTETIMFCQCDNPTKVDGHQVFPLDTVYRSYCMESAEGEMWLAATSE
jgi:hypothetical protein